MRSYEINKYNTRPTVYRAEIWVIETPYGVGSETTGFRWAIIISNEVHATFSNTANVVYLDGGKATNPNYHLAIYSSDLKDGALEKDPCRVNLADIYTVDKKRIKDYKGKVSDEFMILLMKRIAMQLGIENSADTKEVEVEAAPEEVAAEPEKQEAVSESDSE